jgi:hypothetical protein
VSNVFARTIAIPTHGPRSRPPSMPRFPRPPSSATSTAPVCAPLPRQDFAISARFASGSRLKRQSARARPGPSSRADRCRPLRGR